MYSRFVIVVAILFIWFGSSVNAQTGWNPEPGLQMSFMVPFAETGLDSLDFDITDDISGFYGGACYIWDSQTFLSGAGLYVRPGLEISDGFRISDVDLSVALLLVRNLQAGLTWKMYGPELDGENGIRDLNSENLRFFISLEAWSVVSDLFN